MKDLFNNNYPTFNLKYDVFKDQIIRTINTGRFSATSKLDRLIEQSDNLDLAYSWNLNFLAGSIVKTEHKLEQPSVNIVDLFCGCGGLSYGIKLACESVGVRPIFQMAVDLRSSALDVYKKNVKPLRILRENITNLIDFQYVHKDGNLVPDLSSLHIDKKLENLSKRALRIVVPCG